MQEGVNIEKLVKILPTMNCTPLVAAIHFFKVIMKTKLKLAHTVQVCPQSMLIVQTPGLLPQSFAASSDRTLTAMCSIALVTTVGLKNTNAA
jgi:hypothetical protein